jgi:hypothetical protein
MSRFIRGGISFTVPLFPPATPVTLTVDGRPLPAYVRAYVTEGRVFAPVSPLLTRLADRVWSEDGALVIQRGSKHIRVTVRTVSPAALNTIYVMVAPILRALGASVRYEPAGRRLIVLTPQRSAVTSPTPYNPWVPAVAPSAVFTTAPPATPRPVWTGSPLPRRTPLPASPPP